MHQQKFLSVNPYDNEAPIPSVYSTSSNLLNIDTFQLATQVSTKFNGYGAVGMKLIWNFKRSSGKDKEYEIDHRYSWKSKVLL